jgi:phosphopantetheine--protein transferase-like protein
MSEMKLRDLLTAILQIQADEISPETSLKSLDTSLGRTRLRLGLKRIGLQIPPDARPATFSQLEKLIRAKPEPDSSETTELQPPLASGNSASSTAALKMGLDVQNISELPKTSDHWEHEFYQTTFTKSEVAYALLQPNPGHHLAGFWCAKEALRKCDPAFRNSEFSKIIVSHESDGQPVLFWQDSNGVTRLPHAVSISHTEGIASAVVALSSLEATPKDKSPQVDIARTKAFTNERSQSPEGVAQVPRSAAVAFAMSIIALLVCCFVGWIAYRH